MQKLWIEILNPTENDKGKYTLEMFDGQETHKRSLDLSGQGAAVYFYISGQTQTSGDAQSVREKDKNRFTVSIPDTEINYASKIHGDLLFNPNTKRAF